MTLTRLDLNLLDAWTRVGARLKNDPDECLRRWRRTRSPVMQRPRRANCLVIRASDTRLNDFTALIDPVNAHEELREHTVEVTGALVRRLCAAVWLKWPGMDWKEAAAALGRPKDSIAHWVRNGWLEVSYLESPACGRRGGKPLPIVWSHGPLDPNARRGHPPNAVWGTLWMGKEEILPERFAQNLVRTPLWLTRRGKRVFRGWRWLCPGRLRPVGVTSGARRGERGREVYVDRRGRAFAPEPCGRRCRYLYAPIPVWTLALATDIEHALPMPAGGPLAGTWHPGMEEAQVGDGMRSFACRWCWRLAAEAMSTANGWNYFVTCVSGGMLYGHEVERPLEEVPKMRTRAPNRRPRSDKGRTRSGAAANATPREGGPDRGEIPMSARAGES